MIPAPFHILATDYDGTLATHGSVFDSTIDALRRFRAGGGIPLMVTGREIPDLMTVFPHLDLFDLVVAENGALLYWPETKLAKTLCDAPNALFVQRLRDREVSPLSIGQVIVATYEPHEKECLDAIRDLGLELQVIFNKGSVMVLPAGVNKASGLAGALKELGFDAESVVGVGDAENDHALLDMCGFGAAVANALPSLKSHADLVLERDHGAGVEDLIARMLDGSLANVPRRSRESARPMPVPVEPEGTVHVHPNA